jgi:uncharacterized NAD(P)/FAD-binding protein YdhS
MGAVGTTTGITLIRELLGRTGAPPVEIHTFEKTSSIGAGLAYGTKHDFHLLNMRASTMSLFREAPADFTNWLRGSGESHHDEYVPRRLFGDYIRQRYAETLNAAAGSHISVVQHHSEVTDCQDIGDRVVLTSSSGRMSVDYFIMCPGHLPRRISDDSGSYEQSPRYLHSPWEAEQYGQIHRDATVGILGTSLTAVDVLLTLENSDFGGSMLCFSRKRSLPKVQGPYVKYPLRHITHERLRQLTDDFTCELTLREVQALFAQELETVVDAGRLCRRRLEPGSASVARTLEHDLFEAESGRTLWYSALDATGTIIPLIWRHMSSEAKTHFLAVHESMWTMFRHCMPATNARKLLGLARADRLHVHTGLEHITYDQQRAQFEVTFRNEGKPCQRRVDYLVNATGTTFSLDRIDSPLFENMRRRGQMLANPLGGVEVDFSSSQLLYRHGVKSRRICFVGPLTKGVHFYTNSFEMNRDSVERAAGFVVASLRRDPRAAKNPQNGRNHDHPLRDRFAAEPWPLRDPAALARDRPCHGVAVVER